MENDNASLEQFRKFLASEEFSHVSHREWCGVTILWAYRRDTSSPSGVMLACSVYDNEDARQIMAEANKRSQQGGLMGESACRASLRGY